MYYGKDRGKHLERIADYAIIITTYSIVRIEWKATLSRSEVDPSLFTERWGRLVLDEGKRPAMGFSNDADQNSTRHSRAI